MKKISSLIVVCIALAMVLIIAGCIQPTPPTNVTPQVTTPAGAGATEVNVMYAGGVGPMPVLLSTNQVDGYIAWQPYVSVATESGIGQLVTYTKDFPPVPEWNNHPCCVLTARNDLVASNPDFVNAMAAQTILADQWITDHPDEAAADLSEWLIGNDTIKFGDQSVPALAVMKSAIPSVNYTTEPTPAWVNGTKNFVNAQISLGYVTGNLKNTSAADMDATLFNFKPYGDARKMIAEKKIVTPAKMSKQVGIGYLKGDMHGGSLIIAVKEWQYFNDTYGIAIKPRDLTAARPEICDLIVNGVPVAELKLVTADAGPQLMQMEATDIIGMGYAGVPPAIGSIDKGSPIKILMPINTEGSGLVATKGSPAHDWDSFIKYAGERSASGKPLKIAAPAKGSIQDVMLQYSLKYSGVTIKFV
ncbi:MAG: ABC transporter substrate-binding protein [Methanoregulaceae archaeon]|nr:ABC transporter substrate-binding protein [Methanoregulaceae archaeon]